MAVQYIAKRTAKIVVILVIGAILGPVVIAAAGAWLEREDSPDDARRSEAIRLVDAYTNKLPTNYLFLTIASPPDGRECGYEPREIFPEPMEQISHSIEERAFTDYQGYAVLHRWRGQARDDEWISAVTTAVDEEFSEFEAGFLRRCIESTVFSSLCMKRVERFGDGPARFDHGRPAAPWFGWGIEDEIVCTYVDGVAARNDMPLSDERTGTD